MAHRQGATLIEVLVAIFVMGIGLIALLTLFPLGALRMAQAIQDDRCATAVKNAVAIATMKNVRNDPLVRSPPWFSKFDVFKDALATEGRALPADPYGPSYPVFVDPWGVQKPLCSARAPQYWLCGNSAKGLIARSPVSFGSGTTFANKWFTLLDDYLFDSDEATGGQPLAPIRATPAIPGLICCKGRARPIRPSPRAPWLFSTSGRCR